MRVDLNEWLPLRRRVVFGEDGGDGADRHARVAVHAFVGLDVEHPRALVDAVDRTFVDAGAVLHVDAGLCDHVGHATSIPSRPAIVGNLSIRDENTCAIFVSPRERDLPEKWILERLVARPARGGATAETSWSWRTAATFGRGFLRETEQGSQLRETLNMGLRFIARETRSKRFPCSVRR